MTGVFFNIYFDNDMIFTLQKLISFLYQGTILEQSTIIMTGVPPDIGCMWDPKVVLNHDDEMRVDIEGISISLHSFPAPRPKADCSLGILINEISYEQT